MEIPSNVDLWIWSGKLKVFPGPQGEETTTMALNRETGEEGIALRLKVGNPNSDAARQLLMELKGQVDPLVGLSHDNVVKFFCCRVEEWTSLTLLSGNYGKRLESVMKSYDLPISLAKKFLSQIFDGLEFLLSHNIALVINLRNVYLTENGTIKLRVVLRDLKEPKSLRDCLSSVEQLGASLLSTDSGASREFAGICQTAETIDDLRRFTAAAAPPEIILEGPSSSTDEPREALPSLQHRVEKRTLPRSGEVESEGVKRHRGLCGRRMVVGLTDSKKSAMRWDFLSMRKEVLANRNTREVDQEVNPVLEPSGACALECVDLVSDGDEETPSKGNGPKTPDGPSRAPQKENAPAGERTATETRSVVVNGVMGFLERAGEGGNSHGDGGNDRDVGAVDSGVERDLQDGTGKLNLVVDETGGSSTPSCSSVSENLHSPTKLPTARKSAGLSPVPGKRDQLKKRKAAIEGDKRRRLSLKENARKTVEVPKVLPKIIEVPEDLLQQCHRPEPNVYMEQNCYDFTYTPSLLPSDGSALKIDISRCKQGDFRRVLRFGTQFKVFVGKYGIHEGKGRGVVALEPILKNRCVFEYTGALLSEGEATGCGEQYFFEIGDHQLDEEYNQLATYRLPNGEIPTIIDATNKGNASRFLNHSCCPNMEVMKEVDKVPGIFSEAGVFRIILRALRDILKGEELTIDYHPRDTKQSLEECAGRRKAPCHCESGPKCKKWIILSGEMEEEEEEAGGDK